MSEPAGTAQAAPRVLGRYALYEKIASGGMATIHLGRLMGPVGFARTVAIKRLHPQFASDPEFVTMFLDEARLVARINHPNVVPTLDVVATEGELFLVMEYVRGETLSRLARASVKGGQPFPLSFLATIMVGVLEGLHAAHEAKNEQGEALGIVHRDVTPQNILVGIDGVARLIDFGVAKSATQSNRTQKGKLKGKLAYMSPEQLQGDVTIATDLYGAAVVLWEVLTGQRLVQGESEAQIISRVLKGEFAPPSAHRADLPPAIDAVVQKGLSRDPASRFASARAMARAIEDAVPLVTASKVGEWVGHVAGDTIGKRLDRISLMEVDSLERDGRASRPSAPAVRSSSPPPSSRPSAPGNKARDRASFGDPIEWADEVAPTQLSSGGSSPPRAGSRGSAWRWAGAGAALLLFVTAAGVGALRRGAPAASAPVASSGAGRMVAASAPVEAPAALAAPTPSVAAVGGSPVAAVARADASAPFAASAASASASAAPSPVAGAGLGAVAAPLAPHASRARPASFGVRPASSAARDCDPPYDVDDHGIRIFKRGCL